MSPPLLDVQHAVCTFGVRGGLLGRRRRFNAVDDVSLTVQRGEVLAVVGESGCGKTTLSRMMLGLQKPTSGQILLDGAPLASLDRTVLTRRIQPVFQDPYASLNPRRTVGDIIADPLAIHGIGTAAARARRVAEMMSRVGLERRHEHAYPSQLSGGQRQRVAIARALAVEPQIVVCDEPTSALDVSVQAQILNLLKDLRDGLDLTYVLISHDLSVVEFIADRVAVMYLGRIVELGPTAEVMRAPRHPYTQALLGSILTPEPALGLPPADLGQGIADPLDLPTGCRFHPRCALALAQCPSVAPPRVEGTGQMVECHLHAQGFPAGHLPEQGGGAPLRFS